VTTTVVGAGGVELRVEVSGSGPTILLLHGFPDAADVWAGLAPRLQREGYRLVIPDLRGFGSSGRPEDQSAYALGNGVDDVLAILDATAPEGAAIIGHDWGGLLAWHAAAHEPARIRWLTSLCAPHPNAFRAAPLEQRRRSWYMFLFCLPGIAEGALRANDWALFRAWAAEGGMPPDVIERRVRALDGPGALTAALSWYRANLPIPTAADVSVPSLVLHGRDDPYVIEEVVAASVDSTSGPYEMDVLDAGHWFPLTHPDEVADLVLRFAASVSKQREGGR
jgi:pimeloyl-ACP methyl ester carboxylesterase